MTTTQPFSSDLLSALPALVGADTFACTIQADHHTHSRHFHTQHMELYQRPASEGPEPSPAPCITLVPVNLLQRSLSSQPALLGPDILACTSPVRA